MLVALVAVATAGVGLPDLDQLARHRSARFVDYSPGHDDALPDRLARLTGRQVGVARVDVFAAEARRLEFELLGVDDQQGVFRVAQRAAAVRRVVEPRLSFPVRRVFGCDPGDLRRDVTLRRDALHCGPHEA